MSQLGATIALDFRWLDQLNVGGQYRYCVDLIKGLAKLPSNCRFIVIGSQPAPPEPIRHVFSDHAGWRYRHLRSWEIKGAYYLYHLRYAWLLRQERVDLLHSLHTFVPLISATPGVVTIYDMMFELFPDYRAAVLSRPYRLFKHAVQTKSPLLIAISETTAQDINRLWGIPKSNITVVHLSAEPAPSTGPVTGGFAELVGKPFVLSPYNLEPRKNLRALLRAMADVRRCHSDVRLVLYGRAAVTPDREQQFHAEVKQLGLKEALVMTGVVSDNELALLYRHAVMFVFPSLYEGFGLPVLEAMAAGACTVARDQSAMAEVLGDAGVTTETKDPASLATTIRSLLGDPARRADLGHAAQRRSAQFTTEAMARNTFAVYMRALDREGA